MTLQNLGIELDDAIYQAALTRAQGEGRGLEQVIADLVGTYARGESGGVMTSYLVQRGDTLSRIAARVYGDPHMYPLIQQANNITDPGRIWVGQVLVIPAQPETSSPPPAPTFAQPAPAPAAVQPAPVPVTTRPDPVPEPKAPQIDPCQAIAGQNYKTLPIVGPPTDRPAAEHGDINLALRGYGPTESTRGLIDMAGPTDDRAPQLAGLFADNRTPDVSGVYG